MAKIAEEHAAPELTSMSTAMIGRALCLQGYFPAAEQRLRQALPLLEDQQNWGEYIWARGFLGLSLAARGAYAEGLAHATEALDLSKRLKFGTGIAASQILLWGVHLQGRDAQAMLQHAQVVQSIANQAGDRMYVYLAHGMLSWAHYLLADLPHAKDEIARSKEVEGAAWQPRADYRLVRGARSRNPRRCGRTRCGGGAGGARARHRRPLRWRVQRAAWRTARSVRHWPRLTRLTGVA